MTPAIEQFLIVFLPPAVLIVAAGAAWLHAWTKFRKLKNSGGADAAARKNLRNAGLTIMMAPWIAVMAVTVIGAFISRISLAGFGLFYATPFLAVALVTMARPLLGMSLAVGLFVLLAIPAVGAIIMNYEMSAWYGAILFLLDLIWLIGVWAVFKSLPKVGKLPPADANLAK